MACLTLAVGQSVNFPTFINGVPMAQKTLGDAARAASGYHFTPTPGRAEVIEAYNELIRVLRARADLHKQHDNHDLREATLRFAQRALGDFEQLCRKWEGSDKEGKTY